jgi:ribosome-binding factor A
MRTSAPAGCARVRAKRELCLKRKDRRENGTEFINADFAEILYGENNNSRSDGRKELRKTQQFCRQVQRALNLALADSTEMDQGCDLFVDEVSPGPDCGHLVVHVVVQDGYSIADAMSALRRDASRLRSEVAMSIARKRAPELMFVPVSLAGGNDE